MNALEAEPLPTFELGPDDRRYAYAVARRIIRNDHDAQDVVQDALLLAHRHRDTFRGQSKLRTWLHRIVVTTALTHLRSAARQRRKLEHLGTEPLPPVPTPAHVLERQVLSDAVKQSLGHLSEKYREVLALRCEELTDAEISARLAISVGSVKVRSHRARHQLRALLGADGGFAHAG